MPRITIRLSDDLAATLEARAATGQPMADIVRDALHQYLHGQPSSPSLPAAVQQPDLAARVDVLERTVSQLAATVSQLVAAGSQPDSHRQPRRRRQPLPAEGRFDPTKWTLGKLCPRGHEYEHTGQTLWRLPGYHCRQCENELAKEKRQAR
jgi:hypothetical protein